MSKVAVLDTNKQVLTPCHPAVARRLLKSGNAAVWRRYPFTIILKKAIPPEAVQKKLYWVCIDPGSKITGIAIIDADRNIIFAAELEHRGRAIKKKLTTKSQFRRGRRTRNLRYRQPRWKNRKRAVPVFENGEWVMRRVKGDENMKGYGDGKGWVAPSLMSRVYNIHTWVQRLCRLYPISGFEVEHVKFDMQLMDNPEIKGVAYQQGTLFGYEVREYLLEKYNRKCAYCGGVGTQIEHIIPKARGGTNRIDNLALACSHCNTAKGKFLPHEIKDEELRKKVKAAATKAKKPISNKDAAAVNTIRWKIVETLQGTGLPLIYGSGGKTKYNRTQAGLPKSHYLDAACIAAPAKTPWSPWSPWSRNGRNGPASLSVLHIKAKGYGQRDLFSFEAGANLKVPRFVGKANAEKKKHGFNFGKKHKSSGDGCRKYDHVTMTKTRKPAKPGIQTDGDQLLFAFVDDSPIAIVHHCQINHFQGVTPEEKKKKRPCPVVVEGPTLEAQEKRTTARTSQLTRHQHRDGYYYTVHRCIELKQI